MSCLKILIISCLMVLISQISQAILPFNGYDYLQGKSRMENALIIDGGIYNPLLGMSAELIMPDVGGQFIQARITQSLDFGDPMSVLGDGGTMIHAAWGTKLSESVENRTFFYTIWSDFSYGYSYNYITKRGYYFSAPVLKTTYFLVDVWMEPNGTWGPTKVDNSLWYPREYSEYEDGYNFYIVPKWRFKSEHNFRFDLAGYDSKYWRYISWFDIGPIISADLKQYGVWVEYTGLDDDLYLSMGIGMVFKNDEPEYTKMPSSTTLSHDEGEGFYLPWRLSVGWKINI